MTLKTKPVLKKNPAIKADPTNFVTFTDRYYGENGVAMEQAWINLSYRAARLKHDEDFVHQALVILRRLAKGKQYVHVNDFWDAVDRAKKPINKPTDMRLLGAAFQKAAKEGLIRPTDMARKSDRFGSYWRTVWESRVFVPKATKGTTVRTASATLGFAIQ